MNGIKRWFAACASTLDALRVWIEDGILMHILSRRNVALVDPVTSCLRSPDVRLSDRCPCTDGHAHSTRRAFDALRRYQEDLARQGS